MRKKYIALTTVLFLGTLMFIAAWNNRKTIPILSPSQTGAVYTQHTASNMANSESPPPKANNGSSLRVVQDKKPLGAVDDPSKRSRERRLAFIKKAIDETYGKAITGLRLSEADEQKLYSLLIERSEAAYDAHDILAEMRTRDPKSFNAGIANAQAEVDQEIRRAFDPDTYTKIEIMIEAYPYLLRINQSFDTALSQAGLSMSPEQVLPLATILFQTYGSINNPDSIPTADNIDKISGLTALDKLAVQRAESVLTHQQIEILKNAIAARNRIIIQRNS
jgi:hypothetical protein